jgi:ribosomal protein L1
VIGDEDLIASIVESGGKSVLFDKLIATPEFMKPLARAGKVCVRCKIPY